MNCSIFFNSKESDAKNSLSAAMTVALKALKRANEAEDKYSIYFQTLWNRIEKSGIIANPENLTEPQALQDYYELSYQDFISDAKLKLINTNMTEKDKKAILERLSVETLNKFKGLGLTYEQEESTAIIEIDEDEESKISKDLTEAFKGVIGARSLMETRLQQGLFNSVFLNKNQGILVDTNEKLNESIAYYKDALLQELNDYLRSVSEENGVKYDEQIVFPIITNQSVNLQSYSNLLKLAEAHFAKLNKENKLKDTLTYNFLNRERGDEYKLFLNAYNSFLTLRNFDSLIKEYLPKVISVEKGMKGISTAGNIQKYFFNSSNNLTKTFSNADDAKDAVKEMGNIVKLAIKSIPLQDFYSNYEVIDDGMCSYLTINAFATTFAKITDSNNFAAITADGKLTENLINFRNNPSKNLKIILKELVKNKAAKFLLRSGILDQADLITLKSVYTYLYDGNNSVEKILNNTEGTNLSWNLIDAFAQTIDSSAAVSFNQYVYDFDTKEMVAQKINKGTASQDIFKFVNSINIGVRSPNPQLVEKYKAEIDEFVVKFKIGDVDFEYNIRTNTLNNSVLDSISSDGKNNSIELLMNLVRTNDKIPADSLFYNTLKLIQESTSLNLIYGAGSQLLLAYQNDLLNTGKINDVENIGKLIEPFLKTAGRSIYIQTMMKEGKDKSNATIIKENPFFKNADEKIEFVTINGVKYPKGITNKNTGFINDLAKANQYVTGRGSSTTSKNVEGNSIANVRISNIAAVLNNVIGDVNEAFFKASEDFESFLKRPVVTADNLFVKMPEIIKGAEVKSGVKSSQGESKSLSKMTFAELIQSGFINDYLQRKYGLTVEGKETKKDTMVVQPATWSDKTFDYNWEMDLNSEVEVNGETKKLKDFYSSDWIHLLAESQGKVWKNLWTRLVTDYTEIFDDEVLEAAINSSIDPNFITYVERFKAFKNYDENLNREIYKYSDECMKFINSVLNLMSEEQFKAKMKEKGINCQEETHFQRNKANGKLKLNALIAYNGTKLYRNTEAGEYRLLKTKIEGAKRQFVQDFIDNKIHIPLDNHFVEKALNDKKLFPYGSNVWKSNGELVIAAVKDTNGNYIDVTHSIPEGKLALNPILEEYFMSTLVLGQNLRQLIVGVETIHPQKGFNDDLIGNFAKGGTEQELFDGILKLESLLQTGQAKRNSQALATFKTYGQRTFTGILPKMKMACIEDLTTELHNLRGDIKKGQEIHDGGAFVDPFTSILENNSLSDSKIGNTKKTIWTSYNPEMGNTEFYKWAVYTMTNEFMRASHKSTFSLSKMFQKMADIKFDRDIDVSNSILGVSCNTFEEFNKLLKGRSLCYTEGNKVYKILSFKRNSNGIYIFDEVEVQNGIQIGEVIQKVKTIDSLYTLHKALGGVYCVDFDQTNKYYTELNRELIAHLMNNIVDEVDSETDTSVELNGRFYEQPLKHKIISYIVPNTGMKQGAINLNKKEVWSNDEPLSYFESNTKGHGVQQDSDHEIDDSTMTEPSQMISALEANGRTHKQAKAVYKSLAALAKNALSQEFTALEEYLKLKVDPKAYSQQEVTNTFYQAIGRTILKNYTGDKANEVGLANDIMLTIKKQFDLSQDAELEELVKIPFSDNSVFKSSISTFVANINKTAIKRPFPGSGCVMIPSHGIIQNFQVDLGKGKKQYKYEDILKYITNNENNDLYNQLLETINPESDDLNKELVNNFLILKQSLEPEISLDKIMPGHIIRIYSPDGLDVGYNIDSFGKYYVLKHFLELSNNTVPKQFEKIYLDLKGVLQEGSTFKMDVTSGNDLQCARISWEVNGNKFSIFDTQAVLDSFLNKEKKGLLQQKAVQKTLESIKAGYMPLTNLMRTEYNMSNEDFIAKYGEVILENGIPTHVKVDNLSVTDAECVISKIHASKMGLRIGDSLQDIIDQGEGYFSKNYSNTKRLTNPYFDLALTRENGKHIYIAFKDSINISDPLDKDAQNEALQKVEWGATFRAGNKIFELDDKGNNGILIGEYIKQPKAIKQPDGKFYIKLDNDELVQVKKAEARADGIYVFDEYVSKYKVQQKVDGKMIYNTLYRIRPNIESSGMKAFKATECLKNIFSLGNTHSIVINPTIDNTTAIKILGGLSHVSENQHQSKYISNLISAYKNNESIDKIQNDNIALQAKIKYTSFLKSLEGIAARIPTQTMQSFMKMKVVGFSESAQNEIHVSVMQLWLQGSDYTKKIL